MSAAGGPRIARDNMVMCLDAHDAKSYPGEPTANYFEDLGEVTRGEFGQYRNLVSIFETYGLVPYTMTMEIKGNIAGNCYVYMQNGSYTKYSFVGQNVVLTTEYQRFTFSNLTPAGPTAAWLANTPTDHRAMLATYTTYGSGRNPTVRNIQIEKGSYATPFVKRTGGRPDSVNLMIHGNVGSGQSFYDSSTSRHTITAGGSATHSNVRSKFSGGSIYFDGSGDFLKIGSSSEWVFSGDFTVDLWVNPQDTNNGNFIGDYYIGSSSTSPDWQLIYISGSQAVNFWRGGSRATSSTNSVPRNQWSHVALVRSGSGTNNCKIYINGTLDGQGTFTTTVGRGLNLWVGIDGNEASEPYLGYMDEVRVTQGTALWLSNFTPPKRRARIGGAWMNRAAGTDGLAVRSGAAFYGGAATKVAHHSNGQVIEPKSAAIIDCDGTDDWIDTGIILKENMTFSFWYKSESSTAGRVLNVAAWYTSSPNRWFELLITDGYSSGAKVEIWAYGYNTNRVDFYPGQPDANLNWRNLVISFSGGTGTAYMDGVSLGSSAGAFTAFDDANGHSTFWLGRGRNYHYNNANSYTYKDCQIGQFHVWEKPLTAAQVKANFNAHRGRYGV